MSPKRRSVADEPFIVLRTSAGDWRHGMAVGEHWHAWHQLVLITAGVVTVRSAATTWVAPPAWAVWVPAGVAHALVFTGASRMRTAYVRPEWRVDLPGGLHALAASPLLRELAARACAIGMLDRRDRDELALATLIAAELGRAGPAPLSLPSPASPALAAAAERLAEGAPPAQAARAVGLGMRTLERRFVAETGLTPGRWRRHWRLVRGLEAVVAGAPVKAAAGTAGYRTPSAFVAAFRQAFGATPAAWLRGPDAQPRSSARPSATNP